MLTNQYEVVDMTCLHCGATYRDYIEKLPPGRNASGFRTDRGHVCLAREIEDARRAIAGWQPEVRRAMGIPDEPIAPLCTGCEGHPKDENNPCAVCGMSTPPPLF
jgi:hypothetical protein